MKGISKKLLRWVLLGFGVFCVLMMVYRSIENAGGDESYKHAEQIAFGKAEPEQEVPVQEQPAYEETVVAPTQPQQKGTWIPAPVEDDDPNIELLTQVDLEALREVNPEVVGWVFLPDTKINYPILQGEDNDFYLNHTWEKIKNPVGSVFMEYRNRPDFTEFNTIVYAHNMNNGSMFADLRDYSTTWFRESHPYVYLVNDQGVFRYEVFSFYKAPVDSFVYGLSFQQMKTRQNFITSALEESYADMGVTPSSTDRILTLSTCSGGTHANRWVVLARLEMRWVE